MNTRITLVIFVCILFSNLLYAQGYVNIGADPQNVARGLEPGRMWVKYHGELTVKTNSGSGKWSFGKIRSGKILDVSIEDYKNDTMEDFFIPDCGNETYVPEGGTANTLPRKKKLDKDKIQVIVTYDQLQNQGGCITQEQYDQLRSDHEFIVSELSEIKIIATETNKNTKSIQELLIQMKDRMKGDVLDSEENDYSGTSPFWTTVKWVGITAIVAWVTYEIVKLLNKDKAPSGGGGGQNTGGPAPDPWN